MCTVTWWRSDAGTFGIFFNRDERRTRAASIPVSADTASDGTAFLAPRDAQAGGTWLMANAHGLVASVLNNYAASGAAGGRPAPRSRGELPLRMAAECSVGGAEAVLRALDPAGFAPFIFVAWDRTREAAWSWDGVSLHAIDPLRVPLTTSSHRTEEICAWRRDRFQELGGVAHPDALIRYHEDVAHPDPAFNVRMRRPDARTESLCEVLVNPAGVKFVHRRESPDDTRSIDCHEATLPRA